MFRDDKNRDSEKHNGGDIAARREQLHAALRQATHAAHAQPSRNPLLGQLMAPTLTRGAYGRSLQAFYAVLAPVEARIGDYLVKAGLTFDYAPSRRMADLAVDLQALGLVRPVTAWSGPSIASSAALIGCLYVMTGANLGGQVIYRHVRKQLGILPATGGRYFYGRGEQLPQFWDDFWDFAVALCPPAQFAEAAAAGGELFAHLVELFAAHAAAQEPRDAAREVAA